MSTNKLYAKDRFYELNMFIEKEALKDKFAVTPDIDKTTYDYIELII